MISRSYVPYDVLHDSRLTSTEKLVYGAIFGFKERDKIAHFSNLAIAKPLGVSIRTVERIMQKLVDLSYIEISGHQRTRVLRIIEEPIPYPEDALSATSSAASATSSASLTTYYKKDLNKGERGSAPAQIKLHSKATKNLSFSEDDYEALKLNNYFGDSDSLDADITAADIYCRQEGKSYGPGRAKAYIEGWKLKGTRIVGGKPNSGPPSPSYKDWKFDDNGRIID